MYFLGSITSIRSQPVGTCSSLRVPAESLLLPLRSPNHEGCDRWKVLPPNLAPRSPTLNKLLCRQVSSQEPVEANAIRVTWVLPLLFQAPLGFLYLELTVEFPFLKQNISGDINFNTLQSELVAHRGRPFLTYFHLGGCTAL